MTLHWSRRQASGFPLRQGFHGADSLRGSGSFLPVQGFRRTRPSSTRQQGQLGPQRYPLALAGHLCGQLCHQVSLVLPRRRHFRPTLQTDFFEATFDATSESPVLRESLLTSGPRTTGRLEPPIVSSSRTLSHLHFFPAFPSPLSFLGKGFTLVVQFSVALPLHRQLPAQWILVLFLHLGMGDSCPSVAGLRTCRETLLGHGGVPPQHSSRGACSSCELLRISSAPTFSVNSADGPFRGELRRDL